MDEDRLPEDSIREEARRLRARLDETRSLLSGLALRLQCAGAEAAAVPAQTPAAPRVKPAAAAGGRALAARAYDLAALFRELNLPGTGEFEEFVAQALDTEARLRDTELRIEAVRSQARERSTQAARLEEALREARGQGDHAQAQVRSLEARLADMEAKLREAQKRGDGEAAKVRDLEQRAAGLETELAQARQRGDEGAARSRHLESRAVEREAKLREAFQRGGEEAAKLEAKLRQAEQRAQAEAEKAGHAAAKASALEAELKTVREASAAQAAQAQAESQPSQAPPSAADAPPGGAASEPPIPALEPVLDPGWSKALGYLRQSLSAAYAQLRRLSATALGDAQRTRLKAAAAALAQGTDALAVLGEFWDEAAAAPAPGRLDTAVAAAAAVWEPALRRRGIALARRQDAPLPAAIFHPEGLRLALYQVLRNAYESMPRGGTLTLRLFKDDAAGAACVSISDTGPGFSPQALAGLPSPFASSKPGHLGLGLALTRRILDRWGASLEAVNNKGTGACVTLRFALGQDEPPPMQGEASL